VRSLLRPSAWCEFERFSAELAGERTRKSIEAVGLGPLDVYPDLELIDPDAGLAALRDAGWDGERDLVVLNPGGFFEDRAWPLESYAAFATIWAASTERPPQFVVLGLPSIASKAEMLKDRLGGDLLDLVGRTTQGEAFAVLSRARLVLSEDSGLMHMAWVAGAPTLGLFGASRAVWSSPHGNYSECIDVCEAPDGECMVAGHCQRGAPRCLTDLVPERVVERALALLLHTDRNENVIYRSAR
jgi:ADP-heptose:LPS heptosyltransferase